MTITRSDNQARAHRSWKILLTIVVVLLLGYYLYDEFIADQPQPSNPGTMERMVVSASTQVTAIVARNQ